MSLVSVPRPSTIFFFLLFPVFTQEPQLLSVSGKWALMCLVCRERTSIHAGSVLTPPPPSCPLRCDHWPPPRVWYWSVPVLVPTPPPPPPSPVHRLCSNSGFSLQRWWPHLKPWYRNNEIPIPLFLLPVAHFPRAVKGMNPLYDTGGGQTLPLLLCAAPPPPFLPVVMTPSSRMMLDWSNCPRIPASLRNERLCLSEQPALSVFMATGSSLLLGSFKQPRHTSPKSPVGGGREIEVVIPIDFFLFLVHVHFFLVARIFFCMRSNQKDWR